MDIDKAFGKLYEEVKIDEAKEFWAIIDKAKGGEVMAISSDEKGAKSSVKMSNFSKHDYHFGKDPRTLKIVKVAGSYKQGEKMIGTKLSFKEDVEKEARTYKDRADDDEKEKKKKHFAFGGKKKSRHGESGYGKGEEVDRKFVEAFGLDERKMTDAEMAEREEIVKKMKPKLQSFKDRYGDDAEKVMYATATKQAMEEVEIEEKKSATGYELYHKTFSDAMQHAYAHAKSKGFVVDPKEIDDKVATGPKKPSSGKTNRYSLKAGRKKVEIQVANLDNKRYELNMYIEAVELEEGKYRGYDIKKQNRKGQHPLIVPSLEIVGANMKDIKRMIDAKIKKNPKLDIEEVELDEAFSMRDGDKRVVDAFYDKKTIKAHGASILTTDGKTLTKTGMGGQDIAKWVNGKIKIVAVSDVKSTEQILRYMKKSIPSGVFEEVEIDESTKEYAKSLEKIARDRQISILSKSDKTTLLKIAALLDKEKKEDVELEEAFSMGKGDKRVVDAFYDQKEIKAHGASILTTDGKTLTKRGMGGQDIAKWVNGKIKIVAVSDVKSTELILKYMKKSIPSGVFEEIILESTKEYAKSLEKIARDRQISILSKSDKATLLKIAEILAKEKKEEVKIDEDQGDEEHRELVQFKARWLMKQALKSGKRQNQAWWNKQARIAGFERGADAVKVLTTILDTQKEDVELDEAEIATSIGSGGTAGLDLGLNFKKKKEDVKKAKALRKQMMDESVQRTTFAGKEVFIVDSETYYNCRLGKKKYGRYEKYVGNGKVGQTIREYGLKYPRRPIILQNGESGPMLFLKYGRS